MPENQTVWKSNNQGIKEETFIQTGRKGRDGQPGQRGYAARLGQAVEAAAGGVGGPTFADR